MTVALPTIAPDASDILLLDPPVHPSASRGTPTVGSRLRRIVTELRALAEAFPPVERRMLDRLASGVAVFTAHAAARQASCGPEATWRGRAA